MQSFIEFLSSRAGIAPHKVPYYRRWVRQFQAYMARRTAPDPQTGGSAHAASGTHDPPPPAATTPGLDLSVYFEDFLQRLAATFEDWQVDQARDALRLYWYHGRSQGPPVSPNPSPPPFDSPKACSLGAPPPGGETAPPARALGTTSPPL